MSEPKKSAPTWRQVAENPKFQEAPWEVKQAARAKFFRDHVEPRAPKDQLQVVRDKFFTATEPDVFGEREQTAKEGFGETNLEGGTEQRGGLQMPPDEGVVNAGPAIQATQEPQDPGMAASLGRGLQKIGNRATDLGGNLIQGIDSYVQRGEQALDETFGRGGGLMFGTTDRMREEGYEPDVEMGGFGLDFTANADPEHTNIGLQELGQAVQDTDVDVKEQHSVDKILENPSASNIGGFILEQGPAALVDMGAMAATPFLYFLSRNQELAEDRMANDGREGIPSFDDLAIGGAGAGASLALDRFALSKLLPGTQQAITRLRQVPGAMLKGGAAEAGTEAMQEGGVEYAATNLGTEKGYDLREAGKAALGGAIVGGPVGGAVRGVTATAETINAKGVEQATSEDRRKPETERAPSVEEADALAAQSAGDLIATPRSKLSDTDRKIRDEAIYGDTFKSIRAQAKALGMDDVVSELDAASQRASDALEQETMAAANGQEIPAEVETALGEAGAMYTAALNKMNGKGKPADRKEGERKPKVKIPKTEGMTEEQRLEAWRNAWNEAGVENPEVQNPETFDVTGGQGQVSPEAQEAAQAVQEPAQEEAPAAETEQPAAQGVPAMITQGMKTQLRDKGYRDADIRKLKPQEAWDIINAPEPAQEAAGEAQPEPGTEAQPNLGQQQEPAAPVEPEVIEKPRVRITSEGRLRPGLQVPKAEETEIQPERGLKPRRPTGGKPRVRVKEQPTSKRVEEAGAETNVEPTEGQAQAGNYRKGKVRIDGLEISIENPKGSTRRGTDPNGKKWESKLAAHYGDIKGTEAPDGDNVDVFIGDDPDLDTVHVVDQINEDGTFDEPKVILGAKTEKEARDLYNANYAPGWRGAGAVTQTTKQGLKDWVRKGNTKKPFGKLPKPRVRVGQGRAARGQRPQQVDGVSLRGNGTPYSTEKGARLSRAFRDNPGATVVPVGSGFGVRTAPEPASEPQAEPQPSREEQRAALRKRSPKLQAVHDAVKPLQDEGIQVTVVDSVSELPAELQREIERDGVEDKVSGVYYDGVSYVIAPNSTAKTAPKTVLHEAVGHAGVRAVLGERLNSALDQIHNSIPNGKRIELEERYIDQRSKMTPEEGRRLVAEEYVAQLAETNPQHTTVSRVVNAIRKWIREKFGAEEAGRWTRADLVDLIASARVAARTGSQSGSDTRYAIRKTVPPEAAAEIVDTVSLDGVMDRAHAGSYKTNRALKVDLQKWAREAAKKHRIDLTAVNRHNEELLASIAVRDAESSLETNANAVGWYDETVTKALRIVGLIHPEISTDEESRFAFTYALAVTSNGIKVDKNFELAEAAYRKFKKTGKMPTDVQAGQAQKSINDSLELYNKMVEKHGWKTTRDFMLSEFTAGQLKRMGFDATGENAATVVRGAQILGPKIGNGFFSNLNGFFDALTMDRWLMRTWGRWTGTLIEERPDMVKEKRAELKAAVQEMRKDQAATKEFEAAMGSKLTLVNMDNLAKRINKASVSGEVRAVFDKTETGNAIRLVGNSLHKYNDGQKEAPENGTERNWIRQVFNNAIEQMKSKGYQDLTMADLQALLWYSERRLYDAAKGDGVDSGYADDEAPDYANAAAELAVKEGVPQEDIDNAIQEVIDGRAAAAGRETAEEHQGGEPAVSVAAEAGTRGLTRKERRSFLNREILIADRLGRSGDEKARPYSKRSGRRAEKARGVAYVYTPGVKFGNALRDAEVPKVVVEELIPSPEAASRFHGAIASSKDSTPYGAAVFVYDKAEYEGMRLFMTEDGQNGFAIKPDGDIVSVFSSGGGKVHPMLTLATQEGGSKLDAFDTVLPDLYGINGFREIAREPWVEKHRPEGWDKEVFARYNNGEPDVVYMEFDASYDPFADAPRYQIGDGNDVRPEQARDRGGRDSGGEIAPLEGAPTVRGAAGPDPELVKVAEAYAQAIGIDLTRQPEYVEVDPEFASRVADAYEDMEHAPQDPEVRRAYRDMIRQTRDQYDALVDAGYEFSFFDGDKAPDPYDTNPWNAMRDIRANKRMAVFSTEAGFGSDDTVDVSDNPLLEDTGLRWPLGEGGPLVKVLANDLFRAVHDAFGHGLEGAGFRARGEENAWQAHVRLFHGPAVGAMTSETRGQNSWLNFGPHGEHNQTAGLFDTVFADQKTGLMEPWTWTERRAGGNDADAQVDPDVRYSITESDAGYMSAVESGDLDAAQEMVEQAARRAGIPILDEEGATAYKVRRQAPPQQTQKAFKLFRVKRSGNGGLFPLFVGANDPLPTDVWLDAQAGPEAAPSKTGKQKVKSKIGNLAYRPGWHAGDIPLATHIGAKDAGGNVFARKDDEVWAEVEMAADIDYQPEASANPSGDIKHMPDDGMYRFKTNPNMTGNWIISGSMKINRVLSEQEVNEILRQEDAKVMPWAERRKGEKLWSETKLDLAKWGLDTKPARNQKKLLDPVTYDDHGRPIPLSRRFNRDLPDPRYALNNSTNFGLQDDRLRDRALRWMADKMRPIRQIQDAILASGGKVMDDTNVYLQETLFHGKTEQDLKRLKDRYVEPLADGLAKHSITQEELDEYLYALHADERNQRIAARNPGNPRLQDGGSGMTSADAAMVIARVQGSGQQQAYDELADIVYDMLETRRQAIRDGGLETDEMLDAWDASYSNYVPLKGWAKDEDVPPGQEKAQRMAAGKGFEIKGKEGKMAGGRRTRAASPTTQAIVDTTQALIRRRKNEVGNSLLALITDNPNPDLWQVFTQDAPDTQSVPTMVKDPATGRKVVQVRERAVAMEGDPRYFKTKKQGKTFYIKINDQRLMNAMRNVGPEQNSMMIRGMGAITRVMSALVTSYNPEFMVTNFARDIQTALFNVTAEETRDDGKIRGKHIAAQVARDVPKAMRASYRGLVGKDPRPGAEAALWDRYFQEFLEDGAKTGYFDMKDLAGQAKEIRRMMLQSKGGVLGNMLKFRKSTADFVDNVNGAVENATRFSAYVNARRAGISRAKSADLAKNLTVNFNRRGEAGTALNAFFMFANASIQGTMNFARTMVTLNDSQGGKKNVYQRMNLGQKIAMGMVAGTFALSIFNRMMSDEDDDGVLFYDKIADHVKERNFIIMTGGQSYVKIPMPYGYNVFGVVGTQAEAAVAGQLHVTEGAKNLALAVAGSFSPIGFEDSESTANLAMKNLTPTLFRSITQLAVNEDFAGRPVYKDNFPFGAQSPDSSLAFRSTPEAYKTLAQFLNEVTGGSEWRSGAVDVSPDSIQHIINFYGGGAWGFTEKTSDFAKRSITGEKIESYRIPFAGRLYAEVSEYPDITRFYDRKEDIEQHYAEFENAPAEEGIEFYEKHAGKINLKGVADNVAQTLTKLRQAREMIEQDETLTTEQREKQLDDIEEAMDSEVDFFNRLYNEDVD